MKFISCAQLIDGVTTNCQLADKQIVRGNEQTGFIFDKHPLNGFGFEVMTEYKLFPLLALDNQFEYIRVVEYLNQTYVLGLKQISADVE